MSDAIAGCVGGIPYRLALAGGWIDQPFVSSKNPSPPGSMVVVGVQPQFRFMDYSGMATSTRKVALQMWGDKLPDREPESLVRELYAAENKGKCAPSGSQDMIGLIYPGVSRIDYDSAHEGGVFPVRVVSTTDKAIAAWLERVIHILPVAPRPAGYSPLGSENLDPEWIRRLGLSGAACFDAIVGRDLRGLQESMNECMLAWEAILPHTVAHPTLTIDLKKLQLAYRDEFGGAMYSGCGGGYLFVATDREVPGSFGIKVRTGP
ncbi:MAG TPA: hypothetical protein VIO60_06820 [Rectinemataceae bacterium]